MPTIQELIKNKNNNTDFESKVNALMNLNADRFTAKFYAKTFLASIEDGFVDKVKNSKSWKKYIKKKEKALSDIEKFCPQYEEESFKNKTLKEIYDFLSLVQREYKLKIYQELCTFFGEHRILAFPRIVEKATLKPLSFEDAASKTAILTQDLFFRRNSTQVKNSLQVKNKKVGIFDAPKPYGYNMYILVECLQEGIALHEGELRKFNYKDSPLKVLPVLSTGQIVKFDGTLTQPIIRTQRGYLSTVPNSACALMHYLSSRQYLDAVALKTQLDQRIAADK